MTTFTALSLAAFLAASPAPQTPPPEEPAAAAASVETPEPAAAPYALRYHGVRDPLIAGIAAAAWATSEWIVKDSLAPQECRFCERDADGADRVNGLDAWARGARWSGPDGRHTASLLSDVAAYGVVPLSMVGLDVMLASRAGDARLAIEDLVIVLQTTMLAQVLNQSVKFIAARERPYYHQLSPAEQAADEGRLDAYTSFFSGHSTASFALAVSAATVADLRGYEGRGLVWAVGVPLAALTAYLRMGADKHYLTDVVVGAVVGSALGVALPRLLHARVLPGGSAVRLLPTSNGVVLLGEF